jgi:hypothetical protein
MHAFYIGPHQNLREDSVLHVVCIFYISFHPALREDLVLFYECLPPNLSELLLNVLL